VEEKKEHFTGCSINQFLSRS